MSRALLRIATLVPLTVGVSSIADARDGTTPGCADDPPVHPRAVLVLDPSGHAVAGAKLTRIGNEWSRTLPLDPELSALLAAGRSVRTDETGRAQLDESGQWIARTPQGIGWASVSIHPGHGRFRSVPEVIRLVPEQSVLVDVFDVEGAPLAGVEVELYGSWDSRRAITTGDGRATFLPVQHFLDELAGSREEVGVRWVAPVLGGAQARFSADTPPTDPIRLTLPLTGTIVVELVDEAGKPVAALSHALEVYPSASIVDDEIHPPDECCWYREGERSSYVIPFVPLETDYTYEVSGNFQGRVERGPGPRAAGEVITVQLECTRTGWVRARVVDEAGAPRTNESFALRVVSEGRGMDPRGIDPVRSRWPGRSSLGRREGRHRVRAACSRRCPPGTAALRRHGTGRRIWPGSAAARRREPVRNR